MQLPVGQRRPSPLRLDAADLSRRHFEITPLELVVAGKKVPELLGTARDLRTNLIPVTRPDRRGLRMIEGAEPGQTVDRTSPRRRLLEHAPLHRAARGVPAPAVVVVGGPGGRGQRARLAVDVPRRVTGAPALRPDEDDPVCRIGTVQRRRGRALHHLDGLAEGAEDAPGAVVHAHAVDVEEWIPRQRHAADPADAKARRRPRVAGVLNRLEPWYSR